MEWSINYGLVKWKNNSSKTWKWQTNFNEIRWIIINEAKSKGLSDLNRKYELNEIVKEDSIFCATGITNSEVLKGIVINNDKFISETLVTHKSSNYKKIIENIKFINEWFLSLTKNGSKEK